MRNINKPCCLGPLCLGLLCLGALLLPGGTSAQNQNPVFPKLTMPPPLAPPPKDRAYWAQQKKDFNALADNSWLHESWTGNDAPYAAAHAQMMSAFAGVAQPQALVSQYQAVAARQPNNALAQYNWGYALLIAFRSPAFHIADAMDYLNSVNAALAEAPSPHTYNYDRLRYMLWFQEAAGMGSQFMVDMGERLLQKDPGDYPIEVDQALIFSQGRTKASRQHGYALLQKIVKKHPNSPSIYDALACWYNTEYVLEHNPTDYRQALTYYQKALGMYPKTSVRWSQLPLVMDELTRRYHQISGS